MLTKVSFKKQLCHICLESFSPVHLVKVHNHPVCHNCLKLVELSESVTPSTYRSAGQLNEQNPPPPEQIPMAELDTTKRDNIADIISKEGAVFIDKVKQLNAITPGLIGTILGRIVIYLPGLLCLDTQNGLYPIISGIMTADFVTWILFNTMRLPFISRAAVLEFLIYGGMTAFIVSEDRLINIPNEGPPMAYAVLAFLATGFIKTTYWGFKVFIFDEMEGESS